MDARHLAFIPTSPVLGEGDSLKMAKVHTTSVAAQVVDFPARFERTVGFDPHPAVSRRCGGTSIDLDVFRPVPVGFQGARPQFTVFSVHSDTHPWIMTGMEV